MTKNEKEKLTYLDTILNAIKKGGEDMSYSNLVDKLEGDQTSEIIKKLISPPSNFLKKSLKFLEDEGYILLKIPIHHDDEKRVSLTFHGEVIHAQGGLYLDAKKREKQESRQSSFHNWMPIFSALSFLISLAALIRTL